MVEMRKKGKKGFFQGIYGAAEKQVLQDPTSM